MQVALKCSGKVATHTKAEVTGLNPALLRKRIVRARKNVFLGTGRYPPLLLVAKNAIFRGV